MVLRHIARTVEPGWGASRDIGACTVLQGDRPTGRQGQLVDAFLKLRGIEGAEHELRRLATAQDRNGDRHQR
jgi:hypothetical protein